MARGNRIGWLRWVMLGAAVALLPALAQPRERAERAPEPVPDTVEMFKAMEDGQIDVKLIPKDSRQCRVLIENKTDKPLTVKLPEAFAGVPVMAQLGGGGFGGGIGGIGGGGGLGGNTGGGNQAFGGGMGGGMMGGMGGMGGGGGGFFNVPPEKVGKLKVTTVCLEHGKREPRAAMKYEIKPIEQYTDKKDVQELCRMLGKGMMPQRVAQAAAWHLANDMSWQELAAKQLRFANGSRAPYFSPQEIRAGMQAAAVATKLANDRQGGPTQDSLSQM